MKFSKIQILLISIFVIICCAGSFYFGTILLSRDTTGYVDIGKLFETFPLKADFEKQLSLSQQKRKSILDSIYLAEASVNSKSSSPKLDMYYKKKAEFEEADKQEALHYESLVWKELNRLIKSYGESKGFTYIYGADGSGHLMFAQTSKNITPDISAFINDSLKKNSR